MIQDRAAGAIMGALIGDALGLGCHWYYNLDEQHHDYGHWINDYTTPKLDRYHGGMKAGQLSQTGLIFVMLLHSVVENKEYQVDDFTRRLDDELLPFLDGTPVNGPGGYTNKSIREVYIQRIEQQKSWHETGSHADTSEAAERCIVLASRYANHLSKVAEFVCSNCLLTQSDEAIVAMSTAYNCILSQLVAGEKLNPELSNRIMSLVNDGELGLYTKTSHSLVASFGGEQDDLCTELLLSPESLLTPGFVTQAALDAGVKIEPAWKVSLVYGMSCAIYHQLPAAYYLATRFADDFESAVLHAINGGGQNMSRAMLTGALVGAQVGLTGIPRRFIDGLENSPKLLNLAKKLGQLARQ